MAKGTNGMRRRAAKDTSSEGEFVNKPASPTQVKNPIIKWDVKLTHDIYVYTPDWFKKVGHVLEFTCHGVPWLVFSVGGLGWSIYKQNQINVHLFWCLTLLLIYDLLLLLVLKVVFRRTRPEHHVDDMYLTVSVDLFSFPSGHSSRAAFLACFAQHYLWHTLGPIGIAVVWTWALTTGFSRIVIGRHHVIDVCVGLLCGVGMFYAAVQFDHLKLSHAESNLQSLNASMEFLMDPATMIDKLKASDIAFNLPF
eukprot:Clim_evm17s166 gene=Clim_evmTU17s166